MSESEIPIFDTEKSSQVENQKKFGIFLYLLVKKRMDTKVVNVCIVNGAKHEVNQISWKHT